MQQTRPPLCEDGRNLVGILFGDEVVKPRLCLEQRGIEWSLGAIVRMQMKVGANCGWRIETIRGRKVDAIEARGDQRRSSCPAAADEKVAAGKIDGGMRLLGRAQSDDLWMFTCRAEI